MAGGGGGENVLGRGPHVYKGLEAGEDRWAEQTGSEYNVFEKRGWR